MLVSQVDNLIQLIFFLKTLLFEWYGAWCASNNKYQKHKYSQKENWIACPKYDQHSKFNSQHN